MSEIQGVHLYQRISDRHAGGDGGQSGRKPPSPARPKPQPRTPRQLKDAAFVLGIPAAEYTENVHEAMTLVFQEMDSLRWELEVCHQHEGHILDLADGHAFLPILNRRALYRELTRTATQIDRSISASAFLVFRLGGLDAARDKLGIAGGDSIYRLATDEMLTVVGSDLIVGEAGSSEIGVICVSMELAEAADLAGRLCTRLAGNPVRYRETAVNLDFSWGLTPIEQDAKAEDIHQAAENDRKKR